MFARLGVETGKRIRHARPVIGVLGHFRAGILAAELVELEEGALVVILLRAGLGLDPVALRRLSGKLVLV